MEKEAIMTDRSRDSVSDAIAYRIIDEYLLSLDGETIIMIASIIINHVSERALEEEIYSDVCKIEDSIMLCVIKMRNLRIEEEDNSKHEIAMKTKAFVEGENT
jgi:hypothetical protein